MGAIPLTDIGKAVFVTRPRKGGVYIKRQSYPKGYAPPHLDSYRKKFTDAAHDCRSVMSGLKGNEKVNAFNICIKNKLKK